MSNQVQRGKTVEAAKLPLTLAPRGAARPAEGRGLLPGRPGAVVPARLPGAGRLRTGPCRQGGGGCGADGPHRDPVRPLPDLAEETLHPGQHLAQVGLRGSAGGVGGREPAQRRAGDSARAASGPCVAKTKRTSACSCAGSLLLAGTETIATCHSSASGHGSRSVSPVSSRASRSATASGSLSPRSPCPPTCSPRLLTLVPAQQDPAAFRVDDQRRGGDVQRAGPQPGVRRAGRHLARPPDVGHLGVALWMVAVKQNR